MTAYYDKRIPNITKKYVLIRLATAVEIEAEQAHIERNFVQGKTFVIQECYAPGGHVQGRIDTAKELIRGQHELEEVPRL